MMNCALQNDGGFAPDDYVHQNHVEILLRILLSIKIMWKFLLQILLSIKIRLNIFAEFAFRKAFQNTETSNPHFIGFEEVASVQASLLLRVCAV